MSDPKGTRVFIGNFPHPLVIWEWEDAPEAYRALSDHGGDEDYVAFVPAGISAHFYGAFQHILEAVTSDGGSWFAISDNQVIELDNGDRVMIGAHA